MEEKIIVGEQDIKLDLIDSFPKHPDHVFDDVDMSELVASIKANGLLNPIIVRNKADGRYEVISGHRRKRAYEWIIDNIKYNYSCTYFCNYQYFNIEKTLDTKMGICFDYSCLFAAYCRSQNIPCYVVDGDKRNNIQYHHTWNRAYFNGSWWDVDTTNDATSDNKYGFNKLDSVNVEDQLYIITRIY